MLFGFRFREGRRPSRLLGSGPGHHAVPQLLQDVYPGHLQAPLQGLRTGRVRPLLHSNPGRALARLGPPSQSVRRLFHSQRQPVTSSPHQGPQTARSLRAMIQDGGESWDCRTDCPGDHRRTPENQRRSSFKAASVNGPAALPLQLNQLGGGGGGVGGVCAHHSSDSTTWETEMSP